MLTAQEMREVCIRMPVSLSQDPHSWQPYTTGEPRAIAPTCTGSEQLPSGPSAGSLTFSVTYVVSYRGCSVLEGGDPLERLPGHSTALYHGQALELTQGESSSSDLCKSPA